VDVVTIVEIDVPFCDLDYGVAPCEAVLGTTGTRKCYNSRRTCQDVPNFTPSPLTLRFMRPSAAVEVFDGIPALAGLTTTPQEINPGVDLGKRESVRVTFEDCLHTDAGLDKYLADRTFRPVQQGTFFGKLRARYPTLIGQPLRVRRGIVGQAPSAMQTRHYVIESTEGPAGGTYTVVAKDFLKLADGDRAQAPRASGGFLQDALGTGVGPVTLIPEGIGDLDYPSSGKVAIGGSEVASFTRVGDVMTLTVRGESSTTAVEHAAEERVQLVLEYDGESVADIIYDLLTNYSDTDPAWIPLTDWQLEVDSNLGRLYSAQIAEPTSVRRLIDEIIEQAALAIWTDPLGQLIRLRVLRPIVASLSFDTDRFIASSFRSKEQHKKRVSQAWTYYGLRNPLLPLDEATSFGGLAIDVDFEAEDEYGAPAIHQVFSRWILQTNRTAAERVNEILLARYRDPPRLITFDVARQDTAPELGAGVELTHYELQDDTGALLPVELMIVEAEAVDDRTTVKGEEIAFGEISGDLVVFIDQNAINVNLRDLYDKIYTAPTQYDKVTFVITAGVFIGTPWRDFDAAQPPDSSADLDNPNFEEGNTGWTFTGSGSATIEENPIAFNGSWVATLGLSSNPNAEKGQWTNNARSPIAPGEGAGFSIYARSPGGWGALEDAPWVRARILWYDAGESFLSETDGPLLHGFDCLNEWVRTPVVGTAPAGAEFYTLAVQAAYGDGGFYLDAAANFIDEQFAVNVGDWPEAPEICLINNGEIRAGGGRGGNWPDLGEGDGINGATGIYTRAAITIENYGVIAGGGGGGGGFENGLNAAGGGGGAGYSEDGAGNQTFAPGGTGLIPPLNGQPGTVTTGGVGGDSGSFPQNGGDGGEDGETPTGASEPGAGGEAGPAIDGDSYVTFAVEGTVLGDRIN
jgi:hypothetical protein